MTKGKPKYSAFVDTLVALGVDPGKAKKRRDKTATEPADTQAVRKLTQTRKGVRTGNGRGPRPPKSSVQRGRDVIMIGYKPALDHAAQLRRPTHGGSSEPIRLQRSSGARRAVVYDPRVDTTGNWGPTNIRCPRYS